MSIIWLKQNIWFIWAYRGIYNWLVFACRHKSLTVSHSVLEDQAVFISCERFLITADCSCCRYEGMCGDFYCDPGLCDSLAAGMYLRWSGESEGKMEWENHHIISPYISHLSVVINDETQKWSKFLSEAMFLGEKNHVLLHQRYFSCLNNIIINSTGKCLLNYYIRIFYLNSYANCPSFWQRLFALTPPTIVWLSQTWLQKKKLLW